MGDRLKNRLDGTCKKLSLRQCEQGRNRFNSGYYGCTTSKQRFSEAISLLNYGYSVCDIYVDENMPQLERVQVKGGKNESIGCVYEKQFSYLFMDKVKSEDITSFVSINENIDAPIKKGDVVGKIVYKYKEEEIGSVNIIADEDNAKQTYTDSLLKTLKKMLFNSVI